jgi:iron complex transport system substrate-binding protein
MNMVKFHFSSVVCVMLACLTMLLSACSRTKPSESSHSPEMRIIPMAPNLTEILFALGLDEEIAGVTSDSDWPPQVADKRKIGNFWQPDIEAVLACRPTLVITESFQQHTTLAARLSSIGCRTLVVEMWNTQQFYEAVGVIGAAVERQEQARQLVERIQRKQAEIRARHAEAAKKPKVLWVIQRQPLRVAGPKAFPTELIETAGGVNVVADTPYQYPPLNTESLLACAPDVIIEPGEENTDPKLQLEAARGFYAKYASLPAVRDGRIYVIDADRVSRLGPRLDEGMELVEQCLWGQEQP